MRAYRDPEIRAKLRVEVDAPLHADSIFSKRWEGSYPGRVLHNARYQNGRG